jgi:hypothetical protein
MKSEDFGYRFQVPDFYWAVEVVSKVIFHAKCAKIYLKDRKLKYR